MNPKAVMIGYVVEWTADEGSIPTLSYYMHHKHLHNALDLATQMAAHVQEKEQILHEIGEVYSDGTIRFNSHTDRGGSNILRMSPQDCAENLPFLPHGIKRPESKKRAHPLLIHSDLLTHTQSPSSCDGHLEPLGKRFYNDVNWSHYRCSKCGKGIRSVHTDHHQNSEYDLPDLIITK